MQNSVSSLSSAIRTIYGDVLCSNEKDMLKLLDPACIKTAFRKKVKLYHPDRAFVTGMNEDFLNEKFKKINNAYHFLLEIMKREKKIIFEDIRKSKPPKKQPGGFQDKTLYYEGHIPGRKLRFAQYLYYRGIIDWKTLINAIVWQTGTRPRFGEIGIKQGYLSKNDVVEILKHGRFDEKFGETALKNGFISSYRRNVILGTQKNYNCPIGKFFTENGILSDKKLEELLFEKERHNFQY